MKAEELVQLIRDRFEAKNGVYNQCVVLEQVPDGTGMKQSRWIDAVVFQMWESKGLTRAAFEVKVSRSDFLHELQHPGKHQWCYESFHEFWFVAPKDVIQLEELPVGTGWMYPRGKGLAIARNAVRNRSPKLDDYLLAAFMRAAHKEIQRSNRQNLNDVLESSDAYKHACMYMVATRQFVNGRGLTLYPETIEDILKTLGEATEDKELRQDRQHLLEITGKFQRDIMGLLNMYLVIARKTLLARDEYGRYMVSPYGGLDDESLELLKELAKDEKSSNARDRYAEMVNILLSWDGLKDIK